MLLTTVRLGWLRSCLLFPGIPKKKKKRAFKTVFKQLLQRPNVRVDLQPRNEVLVPGFHQIMSQRYVGRHAFR